MPRWLFFGAMVERLAYENLPRRRALLRLTSLTLPLAVSGSLAGCGLFGSKPPPAIQIPPPPPPPPPPPTQVRAQPVPMKGTISAAADLNPSATQRPSPLVLRVYELRSDTAFSKADFIALYQQEQATIGGDLVLKDEFVVTPGENRPYERTLSIETRYLAVFGAYRNVERAVWRAIAAVPSGKALKLAIRAESQALSLTLQP
ncbi:MAG: type VI secretion system lipoprotein TssJ [Betaproteobacteria bacterium]|nr:type VI secretion system lipoprotein TssJ [Betaproteobacteria bacterium]MCC6247286.1 type VI secretion system lipoprotein TssJ [Rubrivivax sp.]